MKKVLYVTYGGGHFVELCDISEAFNGFKKSLVIYKGNENIQTDIFDKIYAIAHPLHSLIGPISIFFTAAKILFIEKPDVIVSSGSEVTIPFFYIAKMFRIKLIYLESGIQIYNPSITGRAVNPITDLFLVQSKFITGRYIRKAIYAGSLI
jgi:beta-1,4-N-acetylglucosaminyltransferase